MKHMKKIMAVLTVFTFAMLLTGCSVNEEQGNYKEGTYFAAVEDTYGGASNRATAVVYVDKNGKLASVFLDTTYTKDKSVTTKKSLGTDYGMASAMETKEWDEQVGLLEKAILEKQGLDGIKLDSDGKTDAVSGCTIKIDALYKAVEAALTKAKK